MSIFKDNNSVYPIQNWLPQSGLYAKNKSIVFNVPTVEQQIITNTPSTQRIAEVKGAINKAFTSDKAKLANRTKMRVDAGMAEPTKVASDLVTPPPPSPVDGKGLSTIGAANIATGISTAANVATSIYGAIQASKMQPALIKYQAPTEAVLVKDNSSAIETAGKENIDKSINTARSLNQRNGLVGMDGVYIAKENEALNQLGSQLAQYRTGIDSQNVQIQNSINAQNKQTAMQVDQFNTQTQNQFDQYKSSLISMGMKNATDAITGFGQSLVNNSYVGKQNQIAIITSELSQINNLMTNNPNWHTTPGVVPADVIARKKQLEEQLNSIYKSIV